MSRAEQEELNALRLDADHAGDIAMRRAVCVGQPQHRALARRQLRHRPSEIGAALGVSAATSVRSSSRRPPSRRNQVRTSAAAPAVMRKVGRDSEERMAAMRIALIAGPASEEIDSRFPEANCRRRSALPVRRAR